MSMIVNLIDMFSENKVYEGASVKVYVPRTCPICRNPTRAKFVSAVLESGNNDENSIKSIEVFGHSMCATFLCSDCHSTFLADYFFISNNPTFDNLNNPVYSTEFLNTRPVFHKTISFPDVINEISPRFGEIYNQANLAEQYELDEISGCGYRKSAEILLKDFLINKHPNHYDKISDPTYFVNNCVDDYIDNPKIKSLMRAISWIGNDHAHYSKRHDDRGIKDLKSFINALVAYIEIELITLDAEELTYK